MDAPGAANAESRSSGKAVSVEIRPAPAGMVFQTVTNMHLLGTGSEFFLTFTRIDPDPDFDGSSDSDPLKVDIVAKLILSPQGLRGLGELITRQIGASSDTEDGVPRREGKHGNGVTE